MTMFSGFTSQMVPTSRGQIHAMVGGDGPPVLLLHGYPQSLLMWRDVATSLAKQFTVVATDLAGYGKSFRPEALSNRESAFAPVEGTAAQERPAVPEPRPATMRSTTASSSSRSPGVVRPEPAEAKNAAS